MQGYVLFGFDKHERFGGANDFITKFNNIEEIDLNYLFYYFDKIQLFDLSTGRLVGCNLKDRVREYEEKHGKIENEDIFRKILIKFIKNHIK